MASRQSSAFSSVGPRSGVSWIGRVRLDADSRVERIEIDPIAFEPGSATPTPDGQQQLTRLVAFLDQMPEARLTATPVVSPRDVAALKQPAVDAPVERATRDGKISPAAAAASSDAVSTLAAKRLETVRTTLKKAGIDGSRLAEAKQIDTAEGGAPQVKLDLAEPESARRG